MSIKHATQTALADDPAYDVSASEWNEAHSIDDQSVAMSKLSGLLHGAVAYVGMDVNKTGLTNYWYCDGSADDVELQAAETYVAALGGGDIYLGRGTYDITAITTCDNNNVHWHGAGIGGTILLPSAVVAGAGVFVLNTGALVEPNWPEYMTFENMTFDLNEVNYWSGIYGQYSASRITFRNLRFIDPDTDDVNAGGLRGLIAGHGGLVENCYFSGTGSKNITVGAVNGLIIRGCMFGGMYAISISNSSNVYVCHNFIDVARYPITIDNTTGMHVHHNSCGGDSNVASINAFNTTKDSDGLNFSNWITYNDFSWNGTYSFSIGASGTANKIDTFWVIGNHFDQAIHIWPTAMNNLVMFFNRHEAAPVIESGTFNLKVPTIPGTFPLSNVGGGAGTTAPVINTSPGGVDIDANDEFCYVHIPLPVDLQFVVRIVVWGYSNVVESTNNMLLRIVAHGATSSEAWSGNAVDVTLHPSEETGSIVQYDVLHWIIDSGDDAQVGTLAGGDLLELMAVGEPLSGSDVATDALFGGFRIEYV